MKGIILSGGSGTRLYPLTTTVNKQLLPVYDKPMIYYPLTTLMNNGIREICIISSPQHIDLYKNLFGTGENLGMKIVYAIQPKPEGLPQAFTIAKEFINNEPSCLILGDNIFHGSFDIPEKIYGGYVFAYEVNNPSAYGVIEFASNGTVISLEEKPKEPKSKYAVVGIYSFDKDVSSITKELKPSVRKELEIVDLIKIYLERRDLGVKILPRGTAWLDAGTPSSLFQASGYIQSIQERTGVMIGCPEETAFRQGFIKTLRD